MEIGDLVVSWTNPDTSKTGIIIELKKNGDCKVLFAHGTFLINATWLKVISESR